MINYHNYFKNLATQNKLIAHQEGVSDRFTRIEYGEDTISYKATIESETFICLLGLPELRIGDKLSDNVHEYQSIELYIVKKCDSNDFVGIRQVQEEAKIIAYQFLSKIYEDIKNYVLRAGFDRNTLTGQYTENIPSPNEYGFMISFALHQSINSQIYYRPDHWL